MISLNPKAPLFLGHPVLLIIIYRNEQPNASNIKQILENTMKSEFKDICECDCRYLQFISHNPFIKKYAFYIMITKSEYKKDFYAIHVNQNISISLESETAYLLSKLLTRHELDKIRIPKLVKNNIYFFYDFEE